jgi:autotransporter strand-loop-strand O-heptosyltransferase
MFENLQKLENNFIQRNPTVKISFNNGARVDLSGYSQKKYRAEFWNREKCEFTTEIGSGFFAAPSKTYYVPWKVRILDRETLVKEEILDLENKKVFVIVNSSSLGDNLAWVPQAIEFARIRKCKLTICSFYNYLFQKEDSEITWIEPGEQIPCCHYAYYTIGYYMEEDRFNKTPVDPRTVPLGKVASDILGIPYRELRPTMILQSNERPIQEKYVCIAMRSTANAKHWHRENGWQDVVDYLNSIGYKVAVIQKEQHELENVIDWTGNLPLTERLKQLEHAEFFIGIGSGLSWLAWSMKKPVILVSGFSQSYSEFQLDCKRIINEKVCNGCWNDTNFYFDKGNWNWCPRHENTERMFECTKKISSVRIIEAINELSSLSNRSVEN